jgi:chromosome segregation ATPase
VDPVSALLAGLAAAAAALAVAGWGRARKAARDLAKLHSELSAARAALAAAARDAAAGGAALAAARAAAAAADGEARLTKSQLECLRRELTQVKLAGEEARARLDQADYEARAVSWLSRGPAGLWSDGAE